MSTFWSVIISLIVLTGPSISAPITDDVSVECWRSSPLFSPDRLRVFMTLSPLARSLPGGHIQQRQIELNWHGNTAPAQGDWIGLYEHDPVSNPTLPLRQIDVSGSSSSGYNKTDVLFGFPLVDRQLTAGDSCLGYWIGFIRNGATIASSCLKIQSSWMWQNRNVLGSVPLYQLFLPGTHNSGSYRPYQGQSSDTVFMRYLICQDEDIWHQLAFGIRYLDIRVGHYPDRADKFWMNHNYARINPLRLLVEDLKSFLQVTREVVVLDFHRFPVGFSQNQQRNRETHAELVSELVTSLGDYMVPFSVGSNVNLDDLWAMNKTLIVAYADGYTQSNHPLLWPYIPQEWGDKRTVDDLYSYLAGVDRKRVGHEYFWAAMAELTPSTFDVLFRPNDGLRKLQNQIARNISYWYRDFWWKTTSTAAVDFFHSTDIVNVAIEASLKRARCSAESRRTSTQATSTEWALLDQPDAMIDRTTDNRRLYQGPRSLQLTDDPAIDRTDDDETTTTKRPSSRRRKPKSVYQI